MECGVSLPWWEMAASSYVTTLQPDYDAGWSDKGSVTATVRAPSLSFVTKTVARAAAARRSPASRHSTSRVKAHATPRCAAGYSCAARVSTW